MTRISEISRRFVTVRSYADVCEFFFGCITDTTLYPLDPAIQLYLAQLLAHFSHMKPVQMMQEAESPNISWPYLRDAARKIYAYQDQPIEATYSPFKADVPLKAIGDYALFVVGIFPEFADKRSTISYFMTMGSIAYRIHAHDQSVISDEQAKVYFALSSKFASCVHALWDVRDRWDNAQILPISS